MGDRLSQLSEQVARKLDEIEHGLEAAGARLDRRAAGPSCRAADAASTARVEAEVARRTQELSSLSAHLQTQPEREKAALARELHDELGGILTPAKMDLAWLQSRLGERPRFPRAHGRLGALIDQGIDLKRRVIEKLRPSLLDHLGLASALQWYVDEACRAARSSRACTSARRSSGSPGPGDRALPAGAGSGRPTSCATRRRPPRPHLERTPRACT
jgi:signal transduction histidine kinase